MVTLEQFMEDHGVNPDEARIYAKLTAKWLTARASIELTVGEDHNAEICTALAYQSTKVEAL